VTQEAQTLSALHWRQFSIWQAWQVPVKGVKPVAQAEQLLTPLHWMQLSVEHSTQLTPPVKMLKLGSH
jgi:hypothetical protein